MIRGSDLYACGDCGKLIKVGCYCAQCTKKAQDSSVLFGQGFAWFRWRFYDRWWVILVGREVGAFVFQGSEYAAETYRKFKANSEKAVAHKRPASYQELKFLPPVSIYCWNHPGFVRQMHYPRRGKPFQQRYYCECGECDQS